MPLLLLGRQPQSPPGACRRLCAAILSLEAKTGCEKVRQGDCGGKALRLSIRLTSSTKLRRAAAAPGSVESGRDSLAGSCGADCGAAGSFLSGDGRTKQNGRKLPTFFWERRAQRYGSHNHSKIKQPAPTPLVASGCMKIRRIPSFH